MENHILPDRFLVISADVYRFVISDILSLVILNRFITIIANGRVFIILYRFGSIVINGKCLIVLDLNVVVFFSVNQYLFRAFFVLKAQLRSEEHTSELQSRGHLVCRLLLE